MNGFVSLLSVEAKALASEQPVLWEFRLYAQVLIDEVARNKSLPFTPAAVHIPRFEDGTAWLGAHLDALQLIVKNVTDLINSDHEDAWGAPGELGDVDAIVRFALRMAAFHRQTLDWSEAARRADIHPLLRPCAHEASFFADAVLRPIENQGPSLLRQCDVIVAAPPGMPATLDASIAFEEFDRTRFSAACAAATSAFGRGDALGYSGEGALRVCRDRTIEVRLATDSHKNCGHLQRKSEARFPAHPNEGNRGPSIWVAE